MPASVNISSFHSRPTDRQLWTQCYLFLFKEKMEDYGLVKSVPAWCIIFCRDNLNCLLKYKLPVGEHSPRPQQDGPCTCQKGSEAEGLSSRTTDLRLAHFHIFSATLPGPELLSCRCVPHTCAWRILPPPPCVGRSLLHHPWSGLPSATALKYSCRIPSPSLNYFFYVTISLLAIKVDLFLCWIDNDFWMPTTSEALSWNGTLNYHGITTVWVLVGVGRAG